MVDPIDGAMNELHNYRGLTLLDLHFLNLIRVVKLKYLGALAYLADYVLNHYTELLHFFK